MEKIRQFLRTRWLTVGILLLVIGISTWTYLRFTQLVAAYRALETPIPVIVPTRIALLPSPTPTANIDSGNPMTTPTPIFEETAPRIPDELQDFMGEKLYPVLVEGQGWQLSNLRGVLYYYWDEEKQAWVAKPETQDKLCAMPVTSSWENNFPLSICYLDFSGLGMETNPQQPATPTLGKNTDGNIVILEHTMVLYILTDNSSQGYQWTETWVGYMKRISTAAKLISEINPQSELEAFDMPAYFSRETRATETSLIARYLGSAQHDIVDESGQLLGSIRLHLFARDKDVLFWVSGEGQVLGVQTGLPFLKRVYRSTLKRVELLDDSSDTLIQNYSYELVFLAKPSVDPYLDGNEVRLDHPITLSYITETLNYHESWISKQLILMLYTFHQGEEWITKIDGELETSPPSIAPYFYIKTP